MIIPLPFVDQAYSKVLRELIIEEYNLTKIIDLSSQKIFKTATIDNCIPVISKGKNTSKIIIETINKNHEFNEVLIKSKDDFVLNDKSYNYDLSLNKKLKKDFLNFKTIGEYCFISKGMVLNADEKKAKGRFKKADLIADTSSETHIKQYIEGKNIDKYRINKIRYLEWNTRRVPSKISRPTFEELYSNKKVLVNKLGTIKAIKDETGILCDQTLRIIVLWKDLKDVSNRSINNSVKKFGKYSREKLEKNSEDMSLELILTILNSNMGQYLLNDIRGIKNKDINPDYLKDILIPNISKEDQKPFIKLANKMLELNKQLSDCKTPHEKRLIEKQIEVTDNKINKLVYELYDLTEEEIKIVENSL